MDTMTYAAFAAFRGYVAEKENQRPVYNRSVFSPPSTSTIEPVISGSPKNPQLN